MYISELKDGKIVKTVVDNIEFVKEYDVIISGLGTAGSMAAAMAAENGLTVLGIEYFNCVGGTTTIGGIQSHYFGCPGGRYESIDKKVAEFQQSHTRNQLESRKIVVEDIITGNGADILYESSICGVYLEDKTVIGVKVITPDGMVNYRSKVMMDCTGDAITAHMAGCDSVFGRELDGLTQPYSMVSTTRAGVGVYHTNCDFGRVDQRDDRQLSDALIFSRAYEMSDERGKTKFMLHMPLIGVREGRRIIAEETVTMKDVLEGRITSEPMFYSYADFDKHGWDIAFDGETLGDWAIGANLSAYNVTVAVPFKAVIPAKIDGIIVPCRGLGVDRDVSSCVRMVLDMKKLGEAGADIAMLAIKHKCEVRDIPYPELRDMLIASGCLDHSYNRGCRIDGTKDFDGTPLKQEEVRFITDPKLLEARLATEKPGLAIWSAKLMGKSAEAALIKLLDSGDRTLRKHSALALAAIGSKRGLNVLRETVVERDSLLLRDCRKNNQQRGCMAIYYLGRLADKEIADTLIEIITDEQEVLRPQFTTDVEVGTWYRVSGFNNRYFQFVTQSVMALIRIAERHPECRDKIAAAFQKAFGDETYYSRITTRPRMSSEGNMILNIKSIAFDTVKRWKL